MDSNNNSGPSSYNSSSGNNDRNDHMNFSPSNCSSPVKNNFRRRNWNQYNSSNSFNNSFSNVNYQSPYYENDNRRSWFKKNRSNSRNCSNDELDVSQFLHPSFTEDPWSRLEENLRKSQQNRLDMNKLFVPSSPNWFNSLILSCAPDNTLIYGSMCDILVYSPNPIDLPAEIKTFTKAHTQKVRSVDVNPQWGAPNKWCISSGDDGEVKLWNINEHCLISEHNSHKNQKENMVGVKFLTENRALSVAENGTMFIWHPSTNEITRVKNFFTFKVNISHFSPCPHASHLVAFGLKNGLVIVADMKKNGGIVHKLRGHTNEIISLSWCPAPFNVFPSKPKNYIRGTCPPELANEQPEDTRTEDENPLENTHTEEKIDDAAFSKPDSEETNCDPSEKTLDSPECKNENREAPSEIQDTTESPKSNKDEETGNNTIHCVSFEEEPRKEYLLASSARDNAIYIWRAGTDGRMQCFYRLPEKKMFRKQARDKKDNPLWTALKWVTPFILITGTNRGEVLKYTLPKPLISNKEYSILHMEHSNFIFSISAHSPVYTAENWLNKVDTTFWTFGYDMVLLNTKLSSGEHLVCLETLSNLILCMAPSPLDPHRIAFGFSNGSVKIWNSSQPHIKNFHTATYSAKILSKIVYLTWHPSNELLLAFCTEEGTIGLINTNNHSKATWFKQYFSSKVHRIQWGPSICNKEKMSLYASAGSALICFDPDHPKNDAVKIELCDNLSVYSFSWKSDLSSILIQDANGKLVFFNDQFTPQATFYQKKKVNLITWHPDSDPTLERNHWLAATIDNVAYVFNFRNMKNDVCNIDDVIMSTLDKHQGNIRSLAWTPFKDNYLVTAGEDGLAIVWDVTNSATLSCYYSKHFEPIRYVLWSPLNENILISAKSSANLILWDKSDYPAQLDDEMLKNCEQQLKINEVKSCNAKTDSDPKKKSKKPTKSVVLPTLSDGRNNLEKVKVLSELVEWKEKTVDESNGSSKMKLFFGSKEDAFNLLTESENYHKEKKRFEDSHLVSFWKGTLEESVKEAIELHTVTPLLVLLSPSLSINTWQKVCETYAQQLEEKEDSEPLEIASYYLVSQNIEKAIKCLCERDKYKEALALVKCRLPEDSVFIGDILEKWANYAVTCGSLETAAQCYIVLEKYEEAVKVLFRREEPEILNFALKLAKETGNDELIKAVEFRCEAFLNKSNENCNGKSDENIEKGETEVGIEPDTPQNGF